MAAGKLIFACLALLLAPARAEVPPLERELNLQLREESPASALRKIEEQAHVVFSYQPAVITGVQPVNAMLRRKTVREALYLIFGDKVSFHPRSNYIILKPRSPSKPGKKKELSGYVYEKNTDQKLARVSVYDPVTLEATTTDEFGYYSMKVPAGTSTIAVNKLSYNDTAVPLNAVLPPLVNIELAPSPGDGARQADWMKKIRSAGSDAARILRKLAQQTHEVNVRDSITRDFQVSFLPFVGTNHKMSGNVYNRLSFNVLGGYARGVSAFEAGGLFNLARENVSGVQLAGLFNVVGDSVSGIQAAGLFNICGRQQRGFQGAGLLNINGGTAAGGQFAGLMNISPRSQGVSGAGLMNITGAHKGAVLAGLANVSDSLDGFAAAGLFNTSANGRAVQVAGLFNVAGTAPFQLSGLFNVARTVTGAQVSVINFADSATGVPVGLLSFVRKGVHQLEISSDEWFMADASFRTGTKRFYNVVSIGYKPGSNAKLWHVGYGIGTSWDLGSRFSFELNLSTHHVSKGALVWGPSELVRFNPAVEFRAGKKITIAAGPTFNLYHTDELMAEYAHTYSKVAPYDSFDNTTLSSYNQKGWIGGRVAVRFF